MSNKLPPWIEANGLNCIYCWRPIFNPKNFHKKCCMWQILQTDDLTGYDEECKILEYEYMNKELHFSKMLQVLLKLNPNNDFYNSLNTQYEEKGFLSEKQIECIKKGYNSKK